jgi:hypothetical protein
MCRVQVLARMQTTSGLILNAATVTAAVVAALFLLLLTRAIVRFAAEPGRGARRVAPRRRPRGRGDV